MNTTTEMPAAPSAATAADSGAAGIPEVSPTPADRDTAARRLAAQLLARDPAWGPSWRSRRVAALAEVLAVTTPSSQHGRLLLAALNPRQATDGRRTVAEEAVRVLLAHGQPPTPEAVAMETPDIVAVTEAGREQVRAEGRRAADLAAQWWRTHGIGPTWAELGAAMGWPTRSIAERHIRMLDRAGWLVTGRVPRSLRPGRLAGGPVAEQRGRDRMPAVSRPTVGGSNR